MADETLHARLCFGLASRYSGHALGPGPLAMHDALGSVELERIVEQVVLEGCIGESVGSKTRWGDSVLEPPAFEGKAVIDRVLRRAEP